jgi:hypothetical protein
MSINSDVRAVRSTLVGPNLQSDDVRTNVLALVAAQERLGVLGRNLSGGASSAIDAIMGYMSQYVGKPISSAELSVVAGIRDYARRIRELRSMGYRIVCGNNATRYENTLLRRLAIPALRPDQYVLLTMKQKLPARMVNA